MTYVLIALVASSFIFEYWLLTKINKLDKENKIYRKSTQMALEALGRDINNFQAGVSRDLNSQKKELDITVKRIDKKVDVTRRDIINSLPTQIRKVIGHIEFAKPLDNSHGRG
jgi:hypothetical protein